MATGNRESNLPWPAIVVVLCVLVAVLIVLVLNPNFGRNDKARKREISCVNNLRQIGLAFRQSAVDSNDRFPFNVSTNEGGTSEWCALDSEGFDANSAKHFQVISNELNTPLFLICPKDKTRKPVRNFENLQASDVTYRLRSGTSLAFTNSQAILAICPVDGNTLYCDGKVVVGELMKERQDGDPMRVP